MSNRHILPFLAACICMTAASAQDGILLQHHLDDRRMQHSATLDEPVPALSETRPSEHPVSDNGSIVSLNSTELAQHPDLIKRALNAALLYNHAGNAAELLPFYRNLPEEQRDADTLEWAEAASARSQNRPREAVRRYRKLAAAHSDLLPLRFQLALALFENNEWEAAEQQFEKLRSEKDLPADIAALLDRYLAAIRNQSRWQVYGGASYLHDPNINNVPANSNLGGGFTAPAAESAQGIGLSAGIGKRHFLPHGFFAEARADGSTRYYWDNKKYSEASLRLSAGGGFQDARHTVSLMPFAEQSWYAGGRKDGQNMKRFSHNAGLSADWSYRFSANWQSRLSAEYARQRYRTRTHLNGHSLSASALLYYTPNAKQYWFAGIDGGKTATRSDDDAYNRRGIRAGWGQEWPLGLSTRLNLGYGQRRYRGINFFNIVQRNKEYNAQVSVWHRAVHFYGITPRLTWSYHKNKGNHALYRYRKQRLFIELSKQF